MNDESFVYLICNPATEQYKIGVTRKDINTRIKQLQTGNGCDLHLVAFHKSEAPFYIEKMLHKEFHRYNVKNEWFEIDNNMNIINMFNEACNKYEGIIKTMKDNPFFKNLV